MADQYQSVHQEVIPCLLSDYDDDVEAHRKSFQAFMTRQAEEHWAAEISSLDIEGSADRIATVIEQEVNRLAKKLDVIATAMAAEADGAQTNRLLAMIPTKLNLMARLEDLAFSRLQPVEGSAERPLAIEDVSPSTSQGSTQCEISGRLDGYDRVSLPVSTSVILPGSNYVDSLSARLPLRNAAIARSRLNHLPRPSVAESISQRTGHPGCLSLRQPCPMLCILPPLRCRKPSSAKVETLVRDIRIHRHHLCYPNQRLRLFTMQHLPISDTTFRRPPHHLRRRSQHNPRNQPRLQSLVMENNSAYLELAFTRFSTASGFSIFRASAGAFFVVAVSTVLTKVRVC